MADDTRIHVNKKTGKSGTCSAKIKCPLGDEAPHFNTQGEANAYITALEAESNDTFTTMSRGKGGAKNAYQGPTSQQLLDRQRLREEIPQQELTQMMAMNQYDQTVKVAEALRAGDVNTARELMEEQGLSSIIDPDLPPKELLNRVQAQGNKTMATAESIASNVEAMRRELRAIPPRSQEAILSDMQRASKDLEHRREVLREVQEEARPYESARTMLDEGYDIDTVRDYLNDNDVLTELEQDSEDPEEFRAEIDAMVRERRTEVALQEGYCNAAQGNLDILQVDEKKARLGADKVDDTPPRPAQMEEIRERVLRGRNLSE